MSEDSHEKILYVSPPTTRAPFTPAGRLLHDAARAVEGERRCSYGEPAQVMAVVARYWSVYLTAKLGSQAVELSAEDVCQLMQLLKIARGVREDDCLDAAAYAAMAHECRGGDRS